MPKVNCCVQLCTSSSKRTPNLSFYRLSKDKEKRNRWDVLCNNANLKTKSAWTSICCLHFPGGFKSHNDELSVFPSSKEWKTVIGSYNDSLKQWKSKESCNVQSRELQETNKLPLVSKNDAKARSTASITKRTRVAETSVQNDEKRVVFTFNRNEGSDTQIRFWTGFYSSNILVAIFTNLLEPHVNALHYWDSNNSAKKDADPEKCGRKRQLQPIDEMFLTLVKQESANEALDERFNLSAMDASRIFMTWVHFMHTVLNSIEIWLSKSKIRKYLPDCFKGLYNDVRVIIDCTEIPLEKPSDFECQAATFSMYEHCNTVKALVGISPSGIPTFISDAYEGSISDNEITLKSGLIEKREANDAIMADRGFTGIDTLNKHKIRLTTPHFLSGKAQMDVSNLV
ncbi:uncharacterized protein LOC116293119 [Actinia tenebrosa]|uniref:Uncharacterized protein LOC116293119 n=1 Tax=Actinia tenebrosa TaxID=6105 RepID=A0A6P8HKR6_ACTTE|nr:uncharacterized protein LOC116293119 [Actinia tenebrosa]